MFTLRGKQPIDKNFPTQKKSTSILVTTVDDSTRAFSRCYLTRPHHTPGLRNATPPGKPSFGSDCSHFPCMETLMRSPYSMWGRNHHRNFDPSYVAPKTDTTRHRHYKNRAAVCGDNKKTGCLGLCFGRSVQAKKDGRDL